MQTENGLKKTWTGSAQIPFQRATRRLDRMTIPSFRLAMVRRRPTAGKKLRSQGVSCTICLFEALPECFESLHKPHFFFARFTPILFMCPDTLLICFEEKVT